MGKSRFSNGRTTRVTASMCVPTNGRKYIPRPVADSDHAAKEDIAKFRSGRARTEGRQIETGR